MTTSNVLYRGVLLKGREAIADYLGLTVRELDHQTETNALPIFHLGRSVAARVERLNHWVEQQESKPRPTRDDPEPRPHVPLRREKRRYG